METQTLHRGRLIDHIQLVVKDLAASQRFYSATLAALDIPIGGAGEGYFWADELFVTSIDSPAALGALTGRHHLAFQAQDRAMVDRFYQAALAHGGPDNGVPGERVYHPRLLRRLCARPGRQQYRSCVSRRGKAQRGVGGNSVLEKERNASDMGLAMEQRGDYTLLKIVMP